MRTGALPSSVQPGDSHGDLQAAARAIYNCPSPSEKLTDSTLPLTWPLPYLDHLKTDEFVSSRLASSAQEPAPINGVLEDYAQLMHKLQAESLAARQSTQEDKALYAAHYASTMIAALALLAMVFVVILTSFPALLSF